MDLNFSSNKLKLVSDNLEPVKQFINGDISMYQLFDLSNKSLQNCLDLFNTPCKSIDEIKTAFQKYNTSTKKIETIMNLIEKYELDDNELFELSSRIAFNIYSGSRFDECDEDENNVLCHTSIGDPNDPKGRFCLKGNIKINQKSGGGTHTELI